MLYSICNSPNPALATPLTCIAYRKECSVTSKISKMASTAAAIELLIPVTVGHFCILTEREGLLLDVVQLVHPLLPRDKLGNGGADTQRTNIIIGLAGSPFLWWNNLQFV